VKRENVVLEVTKIQISVLSEEEIPENGFCGAANRQKRGDGLAEGLQIGIPERSEIWVKAVFSGWRSHSSVTIESGWISSRAQNPTLCTTNLFIIVIPAPVGVLPDEYLHG
jgi:hypothetical protein